MDVFLLIQDDLVRLIEPTVAKLPGFPEVDEITTVVNGDSSIFRYIAPASAFCEKVVTGSRCVSHLIIGYKDLSLNERKELFYLLFDRLTEFVAPQETEIDTVIEAWLLPTQYEQNRSGWSIGFSIYGYAQSEDQARALWNGAFKIFRDFTLREALTHN